ATVTSIKTCGAIKQEIGTAGTHPSKHFFRTGWLALARRRRSSRVAHGSARSKAAADSSANSGMNADIARGRRWPLPDIGSISVPYLADHDGGSDHIGWALFAFRPSWHRLSGYTAQVSC